MGMMNQLFQFGAIPEGTAPNCVRQVRTQLAMRLERELQTQYRWLANCTRAVKAGQWGGQRRAVRRLKLAVLIAKCDEFLGEKTLPELPPNWEQVNLYYGYGACDKFARDHGGTSRDGVEVGVKSHLILLLGLNRIGYQPSKGTVRKETARFFEAVENWRTWCASLNTDGGERGMALADRLLAQREEITAIMPKVAVAVARRRPESTDNDWRGMLQGYAPEFAHEDVPDPSGPLCILHAALDVLGGYPGIRSYAC